jgi:cytochrome c
MKQAPLSSIDQGGGKRRSAIKALQRKCGCRDRREDYVGEPRRRDISMFRLVRRSRLTRNQNGRPLFNFHGLSKPRCAGRTAAAILRASSLVSNLAADRHGLACLSGTKVPFCLFPTSRSISHNLYVSQRNRYMSRNVIALLTSATLVVALSTSSQCQDLQRQGTDVASGQLAFNNACRTCHSVKEDDNRLGPNLYKVLGRKAGSIPNYVYSSAMINADLVWDKTKLDNFIANPDAVVPGNKMKPYGGLASVDVRAQVIAFLESVSSDQ